MDGDSTSNAGEIASVYGGRDGGEEEGLLHF